MKTCYPGHTDWNTTEEKLRIIKEASEQGVKVILEIILITNILLHNFLEYDMSVHRSKSPFH